MAANDRPRPRFEEQAALDELERLRQALEDTRQRRKQATEAFDSFLRSFQRPESSAGPATSEPSAGAQRPPGPPGPVAQEVESAHPEPPAPQPPAVETLPTVEATRVAEAVPMAEATPAIETTPIAGITPIAAATAPTEPESRTEGEARAEVTPIGEAQLLTEAAPATATTAATPVAEAPALGPPAAHLDRPVFQPVVASPGDMPVTWTESQATADDGTVDENALAEAVGRPAGSAISAVSGPRDASDTFVTSAPEEPTAESRTFVPFMPEVLRVERSKVPLMAAIGGALAIVVAASIYFMGGGGGPEETAPAAQPQPSVETAAPATSQPAAPAPAVPQPAAVPEGGIQGELTTVRVSWVRVIVDGEKTIERELPAGAKIPLVARQSIVVRAGDAGAVRVTIDGEDQGSFGPDGAVATRTFQRR